MPPSSWEPGTNVLAWFEEEWYTGQVVGKDYVWTEKDDKECNQKPGDVVPFLVRLTSSSSKDTNSTTSSKKKRKKRKQQQEENRMVPIFDKQNFKEWTGPNLVRCRADPIHLKSLVLSKDMYPPHSVPKTVRDVYPNQYQKLTEENAATETNNSMSLVDAQWKLLGVAIRLRNARAVQALHQTLTAWNALHREVSQQRLKDDANELLQELIHGEQDSLYTKSVPQAAIQEFGILLKWLKDTVGLSLKDYRYIDESDIDPENDKSGRKLHHVAALRGDLVLLHYVFRDDPPPRTLPAAVEGEEQDAIASLNTLWEADFLGATPLMYAARKGHFAIVDYYVEKYKAGQLPAWRGSGKNFNIMSQPKDSQGKTCWDWCKNEETRVSLKVLEGRLEGSDTSLPEKMTRTEFEEHLWGYELKLRSILYGTGKADWNAFHRLRLEAELAGKRCHVFSENGTDITKDILGELGAKLLVLASKSNDMIETWHHPLQPQNNTSGNTENQQEIADYLNVIPLAYLVRQDDRCDKAAWVLDNRHNLRSGDEGVTEAFKSLIKYDSLENFKMFQQKLTTLPIDSDVLFVSLVSSQAIRIMRYYFQDRSNALSNISSAHALALLTVFARTFSLPSFEHHLETSPLLNIGGSKPEWKVTPEKTLPMLEALGAIFAKNKIEVDYQQVLVETIQVVVDSPSPDAPAEATVDNTDAVKVAVPLEESIVRWLVTGQECDLILAVKQSARKPSLAPLWLQEMYDEVWEERLVEAQTKLAVRIQPIFRGRMVRGELRRKHPEWGCWAPLLLKIETMKRDHTQLPKNFVKTWAELKLEYNYVSQNQELELFEDEALGVQGDAVADFDQDTELEEGGPDFVYSDDMLGSEMSRGAEAPVCNILLTSETLKWLRVQKDERYRSMFHKKIDELARGRHSYAISKRLKGSAHGAYECKLDTGQRIIWTQRGNERMVWFVCKHDKISRCVELIDLSYDRVIRDDDHEEYNAHFQEEGGNAIDDEPEMLANPVANVPLKIHAVDVDNLGRLLVDTDWTPPLRLTKNEEEIVSRDGTVLLLGRSGTGKTLCVCNRMARDRVVYGPTIRQLFVSRTSRLCEYVEALQKRAGEDMASVAMRRIDDFVEELSRDIDPAARWLENRYITYKQFCDKVWPAIRGNEKELDALQVWTQIRSYIKGSYEATIKVDQEDPKDRFLSEQEYLELKNRCRLNRDQRQKAYAIFWRYQQLLSDQGWWDEVDRARHVYSKLLARSVEDGMLEARFDRIYVDEIQDITQAEITLLFLAVGNNYDAMFFAGDNAQTVSQGVDFRFEEIHSIVYGISGGKSRVNKEEKLSRNFRSHNGILRVSNVALDRLDKAFPASVTKMEHDTGLVLGPRPGLIIMNYAQIASIIQDNARIRVLVRDEHKAKIQAELGERSEMTCLGIREAKGLEFRDVIILDFFSCVIDKAHHKAWKMLLLGDTSLSHRSTKMDVGSMNIPVSMELELKLLYTAITRSCDRLCFVETKNSQSWGAWKRCLMQEDEKTGEPLAQEIKADGVSVKGTMTADDWMIEGIDVASQVTDLDADEALNMLRRAMESFEKANHDEYVQKCALNLEAVELRREAESLEHDIAGSADKVTKAISAYLDAGMISEASRTCRRMCNIDGMAKYLNNEMDELMKLLAVGTTDKP